MRESEKKEDAMSAFSRLVSQDVRTLREWVEEVSGEIEARRELRRRLTRKLRDGVGKVQSLIDEIEHWEPGYRPSVDGRRTGLEREYLSLRREERLQELNAWRDISILKRQLRELLREYREALGRKDVIDNDVRVADQAFRNQAFRKCLSEKRRSLSKREKKDVGSPTTRKKKEVGKDILLFTVGRDASPFHFNPLIPPANMRCSAWSYIRELVSLLCGTYFPNIQLLSVQGVEYLLLRAIDALFQAGAKDITFVDVFHALESLKLAWREKD
jgi:hypothetical protein